MARPDKTRQSLTVEQENAIDLLLQGRSDREVGEAVGVARQTVTNWRLNEAVFAVELNRRRADLWGAQTERLRNLVAQAVDVLAGDMKSDDARLRQSAAVHILKACALYGTAALPTNDEFSEDKMRLDMYLQGM